MLLPSDLGVMGLSSVGDKIVSTVAFCSTEAEAFKITVLLS